MKKISRIILFVLTVSFFFTGCQKDETAQRKSKTIVLMGMEDDPDAETPLKDAFEEWAENGYQGDPPDPLSPATPLLDANGQPNSDAYNCHYYAWGASANGNDPTYPHWSQTPNTSGYHSLDYSAQNQIGDRIVYYGVNAQGDVYATHSGIVTGVDSNGMATEITSKWGQMGVYEHAPVDVPASYGSSSPTFEHNGTTYESRVYYRAN